MLDSAFTAIGSNFSSRFLLGQFFPVFAVLVVNLLLGCLYFQGWNASLAAVTDTIKIADLATGVGIVAFAACVIAFTLAPMLNALRRLLEGDLLPEFVRTRLIRANEEWAGELQIEIDEITRYGTELKKKRDAAAKALLTPKSPPPVAESPAPVPLWEEILGRVASLLHLRRGDHKDATAATRQAAAPAQQAAPATAAAQVTGAGSTDSKPASDALDCLETNLRKAEIASVRTRWDAAVGEAALISLDVAHREMVDLKTALGSVSDGTFGRLHRRFIALMDEAIPVAARLQSDRKSALRQLYVASDPRPTRFGNLAAALEHYPLAVYGAGYDYLWPRIQLVVDKEDPKSTLLTEPRIQLDYALVALLLAMLSCLAWLGILIATDTNWLRFLLVGLGTYFGFHLFYRVALEAQRNVTESVKSIFDRYRWDLLKELHVAPPADSEAERKLWPRLQSVSAGIKLPEPLTYEKGE